MLLAAVNSHRLATCCCKFQPQFGFYFLKDKCHLEQKIVEVVLK